jgi:hypothetical protein
LTCTQVEVTVVLEALSVTSADALNVVYYAAMQKLLGEEEVDSFVARRGYVQPLQLLPDEFSNVAALLRARRLDGGPAPAGAVAAQPGLAGDGPEDADMETG